MRFGDAWPKDMISALRLLGSVGEPINPEAWRWYHSVIGKEKMPDYGYLVANGDWRVYDHPSADYPLKPAQRPNLFLVHEMAVVDDDGKEVKRWGRRVNSS